MAAYLHPWPQDDYGVDYLNPPYAFLFVMANVSHYAMHLDVFNMSTQQLSLIFLKYECADFNNRLLAGCWLLMAHDTIRRIPHIISMRIIF